MGLSSLWVRWLKAQHIDGGVRATHGLKREQGGGKPYQARARPPYPLSFTQQSDETGQSCSPAALRGACLVKGSFIAWVCACVCVSDWAPHLNNDVGQWVAASKHWCKHRCTQVGCHWQHRWNATNAGESLCLLEGNSDRPVPVIVYDSLSWADRNKELWIDYCFYMYLI